MRNILITGKTGYIAQQLAEYLACFPEKYRVTSISVRSDTWKGLDLSQFDTVVHTAGIVHKKETPENASLYYKVNRDLTVELAEKAKSSGVRAFIFLSSVSVYGIDEGVITRMTPPNPVTHYGKSKLQAEERLRSMDSDIFAVTIVRSPMVYGNGCKGNYQALVRLAKLLPVFASYENQRSLIRVDRLSRFLSQAIDGKLRGIYFPQDPEYFCTSHILQQIAAESGKRLPLTPLLNPIVHMAKSCTQKGRKAFGSLIYKGGDCVEKFCIESGASG